jgi:hypothetical protein
MIESGILQEKSRERGRAQNVLQDFLVNRLYIPKIYLDADWNGLQVDLLAVDRAGVGDVHAVRMMPLGAGISVTAAFVLIDNNMSNEVFDLNITPCHFRYLAIVSDDPETSRFDPKDPASPKLFAKDGVGRIGIVYVDLSKDDPTVSTIVKPERFRSSKEIIDLADHYVADHTANWEIRE